MGRSNARPSLFLLPLISNSPFLLPLPHTPPLKALSFSLSPSLAWCALLLSSSPLPRGIPSQTFADGCLQIPKRAVAARTSRDVGADQHGRPCLFLVGASTITERQYCSSPCRTALLVSLSAQALSAARQRTSITLETQLTFTRRLLLRAPPSPRCPAHPPPTWASRLLL